MIDSQGQVLADSGAVPEKMENHARRPEFQAALAGQVGMDTRNSHTLGVDLLYVAQPVPGGAVRLAVPLSAIAEANRKVWRSLVIASALACFIAILLSAWASQKHQRTPGTNSRICRKDGGRRLLGPPGRVSE